MANLNYFKVVSIPNEQQAVCLSAVHICCLKKHRSVRKQVVVLFYLLGINMERDSKYTH